MIVIPMAGLSSRFFNAGYTKPKYMLQAAGLPLFDYAVVSFRHYFEKELFLFIVRDIDNTVEFIKERVGFLGIKKYKVVVLSHETRGQAETVAKGLQEYNNSSTPITIFNIDTFRPNFIYPKLESLGDGYLEVFIGEGDNWSFVRPIENISTKIDLTTEKKPISDYCCTGLYYFKSCIDYFESYNNYLTKPTTDWEKGELYIAPLYNYLIKKGKNIHYNLIDRTDVVFCGTPDEYTQFLVSQEQGLENV
ncbi:glycosyltransferase family 2 protein [Pseudoalteromonas atlantica]|uniref:glycosyltransferase family 2 protein n=1 Tax=Pseudoalteromonas atlantica TaxID=288 RepID=UPI0037354542